MSVETGRYITENGKAARTSSWLYIMIFGEEIV